MRAFKIEVEPNGCLAKIVRFNSFKVLGRPRNTLG